MVKASKSNSTKSRKVMIPGVLLKTLKPVANLISPQILVVPMTLTCMIGQIVDNLKGALTPKEAQQLGSIKLYSKAIGSGDCSKSLSAVHALASTLGPEAKTLSLLPPAGRQPYLEGVKEDIQNKQGPARVMSSSVVSADPEELAKHRRGLALQQRSMMQAAPVYSKNQLTIGMPIKDINLETIIDSAKQFWVNLGKEAEAFDSQLQALVPEAKSPSEAVTILVESELKKVFPFSDKLVLSEDSQVLKGEDNLTPLERELGIIERVVPVPPEEVQEEGLVDDPILQAALAQQKEIVSTITTSLKKAGRTPASDTAKQKPAKAAKKSSKSVKGADSDKKNKGNK